MFRHRPALAAELLANAFHVDLPAWQQARLESSELTDAVPTEYRADAVITLAAGDQPVLAVIVEVQLRRDHEKRWTWPVYVATLRARLRCSTVLLVVCPDKTIAEWCASPIEIGHPDWVLTPLVLGPQRAPVVTDLGQASRFPELTVLSAIAHGDRPDREPVLRALLAALDAVDQEHMALYAGVVMAALPAAARRHLEALMATATHGYRDYLSDFVNKFVNQGRAEGEITGKAAGEAEALLTVLAARDIAVPDDARARITGCTDLDQLETWIRRAVTANSVHDVFG